MRNFADKFFIEKQEKREAALGQLDGLYVSFHSLYQQADKIPEESQSETEKAIVSGFENFQPDSDKQMLALSSSILSSPGDAEPSTMVADTPTTIKKQRESKTMNQDDIKKLIKEAFTDKVYGKYPYSHKSGDQEEPAEDYMETWKKLCLDVVRDESRTTAIAVAKLLVKDLELFEDVLDLAGQNQSVGTEILKIMEKNEKDMI